MSNDSGCGRAAAIVFASYCSYGLKSWAQLQPAHPAHGHGAMTGLEDSGGHRSAAAKKRQHAPCPEHIGPPAMCECQRQPGQPTVRPGAALQIAESTGPYDVFVRAWVTSAGTAPRCGRTTT